jgi:hypothetical protein
MMILKPPSLRLLRVGGLLEAGRCRSLFPLELVFFSQDWTKIGFRYILSLQISEITKIDSEVLIAQRSPQSKSVAQRMTWASRRRTTRTEDMAYCLMGLFDVNMPLLYGEGKKAFVRLQEEILKRSNDRSLFAWTATGRDHSIDCETSSLLGGLLARWPSDFEHSSQYIPYTNFQYGLERPYSMTNLGLCIDLLLYSVPDYQDERIALLSCCSTNNKSGHTNWHLDVAQHSRRASSPRPFSQWTLFLELCYGTTLCLPTAYGFRTEGPRFFWY